MSTCANHPAVPAQWRCEACGRLLCGECVTHDQLFNTYRCSACQGPATPAGEAAAAPPTPGAPPPETPPAGQPPAAQSPPAAAPWPTGPEQPQDPGYAAPRAMPQAPPQQQAPYPPQQPPQGVPPQGQPPYPPQGQQPYPPQQPPPGAPPPQQAPYPPQQPPPGAPPPQQAPYPPQQPPPEATPPQAVPVPKPPVEAPPPQEAPSDAPPGLMLDESSMAEAQYDPSRETATSIEALSVSTLNQYSSGMEDEGVGLFAEQTADATSTLRSSLEGGDDAAAVQAYNELAAQGLKPELESQLEAKLARVLDAAGMTQDAIQACRRIVMGDPQSPMAPGALFTGARLASGRLGDQQMASRLLQFLIEKYPESNLVPQAQELLRSIARQIQRRG